MTLHFHIRKEDVLAFSREFSAASPTHRKVRTSVRWMLPAPLLCLWLIILATRGFDWRVAILCLGLSMLWYFLYPAHYDRSLQRYAEKFLAEGSYGKTFGPCALTLSDSGLHSKSNTGESTFYWPSVDRVLLTDSHLFLFLNGSMGYPVPIADIGLDAAKAAYDYAQGRLAAAATPSP